MTKGPIIILKKTHFTNNLLHQEVVIMNETMNMQTHQPEKAIDKEKYTQLMASNLKVLRAKAGMTQDDLSKAAGISRQTIVQAEATHKLSWGTYLALVFLFSTDDGTSDLMRLLDIYPANLRLTNFSADGE